MTRTIPLTRGYFATVDEHDFDWLSCFAWWAAERENTVYAISSAGYMHRMLMDAPDEAQVDHKNHNGLDNRRANLRVCTRGQNRANQRKTRGGSIYKGVSRSRGTWRATIKQDRQQKTLGYFKREEDAARAYDCAAVDMFGEFAKLNFPDELGVSRRVVSEYHERRRHPVHLPKWKKQALVRAHQECGFTYAHLARVFGVHDETARQLCLKE